MSDNLNSITLFSHAPIDIRAIRALAKRLSVPYADFSAVALAKSIDNINTCFQNYVDSNSVHNLLDTAILEEGYNSRSFPSLYHPFEFIIWNRNLTHLDLPNTYKGYEVTFVHGHDSRSLAKENLITLDNLLGKTAHFCEATYTALYSHEIQLIPTPGWSSALFTRTPSSSVKTTEKVALCL